LHYGVLGCLLDDGVENKIEKKVVTLVGGGFVVHICKIGVQLKLKPKKDM